MKEMIYGTNSKREILDHGLCWGIEYYILSLGTHPTAYINMATVEGIKANLYNKIIDKIDECVHGGITYHKSYLHTGEDTVQGDFIGWDYLHIDDYVGVRGLGA